MKLLITCALLFAFTPRLFCQSPEQQGIRAEDVINRMYAHDVQREARSGGYVGTRRYTFEVSRIGTKDGNLFEVSVAMRFGYAGVRPQLNVRRVLNLVDQVLRHGAGK